MRISVSIIVAIVCLLTCPCRCIAQPNETLEGDPPAPMVTESQPRSKPREVAREDLTEYEFDRHEKLIFSKGSDQYPTLHWSGFLQLDSGWVIQDEGTTDAVGSVNAETGLRRVRLRVGGKVREGTSYVVDLDFAASGHPSFRDVAVIFSDPDNLQNLEAGYFKQPFGMDAESSGRELLLLERQLPFAFAPFRQTGVRAFGTFADDQGTFALSAYRTPTDSFGVSSGNNGGWGFATRDTFLIIDRGDSLLHIGFGYSLGNPANDRVRYAVEPGFFVGDPTDNSGTGIPTFVDTGPIPTHTFHLFNVELAAQCGPFRAQSEYRWSHVDRPGASSVNFSGGYFQLGFLLTGESATYNRKRGIFTGVIPQHEFGDRLGAIEFVTGWSVIDLNDKDIAGGRMQTLTFGLNWYINDFARVMLNAIPVTLDTPGVGRGESLVLATRLQLEF